MDNVDSAFSSAGAALNHGATLARNDYFVFVHQDVYLHSIRALEQAAGRLADDESLGLIGAIGIHADGRLIFQGITQRDLIVVKSVVMLLVFAVILVNFLVDMSYLLVDPRLRRR